MQEPDVLSRATIRVIKVSGRNETIEFDDELFLTKMIGMCKISMWKLNEKYC